MLKSMTGYGSAMGPVGNHRLSVEVKSVNHKYCEVNFRISSAYASLESRVVELAKNFFKRGRIDVFVRGNYQNGLGAPLHLDLKKIKSFHGELLKASKELKISSNIDLNTLLAFPQMVLVEEEEDLHRFWTGLEELLKKAFLNLEKMRRREGKGILTFLKGQLQLLAKEVRWIEKAVPKTVKWHRDRLEERIQKITQNLELDPIRLSQEVAYFVDRTDISEELQRLGDHISHFGALLKSSEPMGRKLDFLLQEMNREVNTLSAKVQNARISQRVVECKHALEKMREQVQNVE